MVTTRGVVISRMDDVIACVVLTSWSTSVSRSRIINVHHHLLLLLSFVCLYCLWLCACFVIDIYVDVYVYVVVVVVLLLLSHVLTKGDNGDADHNNTDVSHTTSVCWTPCHHGHVACVQRLFLSPRPHLPRAPTRSRHNPNTIQTSP